MRRKCSTEPRYASTALHRGSDMNWTIRIYILSMDLGMISEDSEVR